VRTLHLRPLLRALAGALLLLACVIHPLNGQQIRSGDRVRIESLTGTATLLEVTLHSLVVLRNGDRTRLSMPRSSLAEITVCRGRRSSTSGARRAAVPGALVGSLVGIVVAVVDGETEQVCWSGSDGQWSLWGSPQTRRPGCSLERTHRPEAIWQLALAGAGAGALFGAVRPGERWEKLTLPGHARVAPSGDGRVLAGLSIGF
jgi:hypothetical protein